MSPVRQRGFALIVVFLLVIVMVGLAASVLVSTQGDLQVAGQDREAATSFYAAEAGVAFAKDWLATQNIGTGTTAWSALLASGSNRLCAPANGARPGTALTQGQLAAKVAFDAARGSSYQFCFHNNIDDPKYWDNPPTGDTTDSDGILAIESYGWGPGGSANRLSVQVRVGAAGQAVNDYTCEGGDCGRKGGGGERNAAIDTSTKATF